MINQVLLSLMNPTSEVLVIEELLADSSLEKFLHPGERTILEKIINIAQQHRDIYKFTKKWGLVRNETSILLEEDLQNGVYLQSFAVGVEKVLVNYKEEICALNEEYLLNPSSSLLFIYKKVEEFVPLLTFLQKLIEKIKTQRQHGCSLLQTLHQNRLHGDWKIKFAMKIIQKKVCNVFLHQLINWVLYGKLIDKYNEFFIKKIESVSRPKSDEQQSTISDPSCLHSEICDELLPYCFTHNWAEKVLFIGQTVLMFEANVKKTKNMTDTWNDVERAIFSDSLWNDKQSEFFKKFQEMEQNDDFLHISKYERIIDDIKSFVTERLSQIAYEQADLIKQLHLIKEFYLLGRGELFLEFIKLTKNINMTEITEHSAREIIKAFEKAAIGVNALSDFEFFKLTLTKTIIGDSEIKIGYFQYLTLSYNIKWPLHLIFSPKIIKRYNDLFRFLLVIKVIQHKLHTIWCDQRKNTKILHTSVLQLRNQLMFIVDNLQYYLQIDVLESQFSILMNTIQHSTDFEHIQRAHCVFQANILSLCFLFPDNKEANSTSGFFENSIYMILNQIFLLCEAFCKLIETCENPITNIENEEFILLDTELKKVIEVLMSNLFRLKSAPNLAPLSQLLLRLDFNYWFSNQKINVVEAREIS